MQAHRPTLKITLSFLGVLAIWSTTPIAIKIGATEFDANLALALRLIIASLVGSAVCLLLRKPLPMHWRAFALYLFSGLVLYVGMKLVYFAALTLNSGTLSVLHGLGPMISALMSMLVLKQFLSLHRWLCLIVGLVGLSLVFAGELTIEPEYLLPMLMTIAAVTLHMTTAVIIKKANLQIAPLALTTGGLIAAALMFAVELLLESEIALTQPSLAAWLSIVYLAVIGSVVAYVMYFYLLLHLSPVQTGFITVLSPVFALSIGMVFADEQFTATMLIGSLIVLASVAWFMLPAKKQPFANPPLAKVLPNAISK